MPTEKVLEDGGARLPSPGEVVRVRTRTYLVEDVERDGGRGTLVRMACLDDDNQGQPLEVIWELELDTQILDREVWQAIGKKGFDPPKQFGAYIHTLRWNCVTATDPRLFQAPFRAGIRIDAYQLEPLRKALLLPRVNLFIADDVGLGKTIEAALIASELLLRRRVHEVVVACPPTMLAQWKDELETRFGLTFEILDRSYVERMRRERGYGINPWTTFPRFLVSQRLLVDEAYVGPMRAWLENFRPGSLLILDEAHHAAPSSGARYAIDSRITRAIRDIAPRFEHRLFLSATPHNGHSNSFSALLELLDDQRFTRGVKVVKSNLDSVMVRRLKDDLRALVGGFPEREVDQIDLTGLPADQPELVLSRLLDQYREVRQRRIAGLTKRKQAEAALLISGLQQRLLSSIEAFARTLKVHRATMERLWAAEPTAAAPQASYETVVEPALLAGDLDRDDDRSQLEAPELEALEDQAIATATAETAGAAEAADVGREQALLEEMTRVAEAARGLADARVRYLVEWIRRNMCPGVHLPGEPVPKSGAAWSDLRLLIFTEYQDTERYLVNLLRLAVADTDLAEHRIDVFHGPTPLEVREAIKRNFNLPPDKHPIRILVATDAAREGINLQAHCHHLFHFDVPWNPSRLEQRNGRIDRKLQPAPQVYCHYFFYTQRSEDPVLRALVRKTATIHRELGSLAEVLEARLAETLRGGIRHDRIAALTQNIEEAGPDAEKQATVTEELEEARERQEALQKQLDGLRNRINDAQKWINFDTDQFREALSCALELLRAEPLAAVQPDAQGPHRYAFPNLDTRRGGDPSWATTLDTLRELPKDGIRNFAWRRQSPIRPVIFDAPQGIDDETVQLHLSHRVVQRLLGRFLAQGFVHHDLSRACLGHTTDAIPRVVLLGRLSLYGAGAVRLHEEILTVTARWVEPDRRRGQLTVYGREAESKTLELLESALRPGRKGGIPDVVEKRLHAAIPRDIEELFPHLETRGQEARVDADAKLKARGQAEARAIRDILETQRRRVETEVAKPISAQLRFDFDETEKRQVELNRRYWERWLSKVAEDLEREPDRIRSFYRIASSRIEPIGLAYLWPVTG